MDLRRPASTTPPSFDQRAELLGWDKIGRAWRYRCPACETERLVDGHEARRTTRPIRCRSCRRDLFPPPALPEVGVDDDLRRAAKPSRRYMNRCFEEAMRFVLRYEGERAARLVHGTYSPPESEGHRCAHAWVEIEGRVAFDPNYQRFYDLDAYVTTFQTEKLSDYDRCAAAGLPAAARYRLGPWDEPEDQVRG